MADQDYLESTAQEAQEIADTLKQLDTLLASEKLAVLSADDVNNLRRDVRKMLISMSADVESLASLERETVIKTDPSFVSLRHQLIKSVETAKVDFEFNIVPVLQKLTSQAVQQVKENPPETVDESTLPPPPPDEKWTVDKVIDTAEGFVDQASKATGVITKAYTLVKALGMIVGIPIP